MNFIIKKCFKSLIVLFLFISVFSSYSSASAGDGVILSDSKQAFLCKNSTCDTVPTSASRINFKPTNVLSGQEVKVTSSGITGYAWSEDMGWINMNPTQSGVDNNGSGVLSGYAWGQNAGWINFKPTNGGVVINSSGEFNGYAWAQNYGWIKFDCSSAGISAGSCVKTDWRASIDDDDDDGNGVTGTTITIINPPVTPPVVPPILPPVIPPVVPVIDIPVVPVEPPVIPNTIEIVDDKEESNDNDSDTGDSRDDSNFISLAITQETIDNILENINIDPVVVKKVVMDTIEVMKTPVGRTITDIITATGVVSGASLSIATLLFANPLTLSELFLIPLRIWSLILAALGIKKRSRPWGTVYDSVTKQPLDPAYVVLQDLNGNEVATSITDLDGRYGFLVPAGQYRLLANKTNYEFPSKKLMGKLEDELYPDLYFNEVLTLAEGEVVTKNIPMDPLKFDWNEFAKKDQKLMKFFSKRDVWVAHLSNFLFNFGFIITAVTVVATPKIYNVIIFCIYALLYLLKHTVLKRSPSGKITQNGYPLSFAIIRVFSTATNHEIIHKVADKIGKYYCLIPNGNYYVKIEKKNEDGTYTLVHTSNPIKVKDGYIGNKFNI